MILSWVTQDSRCVQSSLEPEPVDTVPAWVGIPVESAHRRPALAHKPFLPGSWSYIALCLHPGPGLACMMDSGAPARETPLPPSVSKPRLGLEPFAELTFVD